MDRPLDQVHDGEPTRGATNAHRDLGDAPWWHQAVVYQIYPRSFADADGDGIGDLQGITSRVWYLRGLGIDAVWLSPFYPSDLADGGYDVADYRDVHPTLGTLDDFDAMVKALHDAGIRLMIDIVPNHTSDQHPWFREALAAGRGSPARDRYVFREGTGPDGSQPPSDWQSMFGGSAWTRVDDGQWYLHAFATEQPDLNWDHPDVRTDFLTTLRFWFDRGVDGVRVDAAHGLAKDLREPFEPAADLTFDRMAAGAHPLWDRDEVHEIYAQWRKVFDSYDPPRVGVAEAAVYPARRSRYTSGDSLGQAFTFDLLEAGWSAAAFRDAIATSLMGTTATGPTATWVLSNHDVVRHASRYGLPHDSDPIATSKAWLRNDGTVPSLDRALGEQRARAATLLMLALPGSAYLYQGEELGLHEVADLPFEHLQDPTATRSGGTEKGRDGSRVPLPWTADDPAFGFGGPPHLPQPGWFADHAVDRQLADRHSVLRFYQRSIALRARLQATATLTFEDDEATVLHVVRPGGWHILTNFGTAPIALPNGAVVIASHELDDGKLPPDTTVWLIEEGAAIGGSLPGR